MIKITIENTESGMTIERYYKEEVSEEKLGELTKEMIEKVSPEDKPVPF